MIGRYEVHQEIGRGTTGTVYLAHDPLIGRRVALKTLSEEFSLAEEDVTSLRRRLLNEAQSAGSLSHRGIVAIYDVIEHGDNRLSIASEYVEGTDLRRRLDEPEPLPLEFASRVVSEVAEALDYAHAQGVVHRDLKPANILIGRGGEIKVTDFGIASLRDRDLADELKNLGSPNYLAPERILGQEAEARSDVYALGVVLYEMLTRNPPFSGDSVAELARNIVQERPAPVDHFRPDLFPEVSTLIERALAKEPVDRYGTAGELAEDLRRTLRRRASHSDTVPTPVLEELALTESVESAEPAKPSGPSAAVSRPPEAPSGVGGGAAAVGVAPSPPPARGRRSRSTSRAALFLLPVLLGLALAAAAFVGGRWMSDPAVPASATPSVAPGEGEEIEYLRLLAQSRRLFAEGRNAEAQRLLDEAERLSPAAARIRRLRDSARTRVESERLALAEAEALDQLDQGRADLESGRLRSAAAAVARALELLPENEEALELRDEIARRRAWLLARERASEAEPEAVAVPAAADEGFRPFSPPDGTTVTLPATAGSGDLRIDFYSERPRGVLTVYADSQQVLNRPFRFFEKKSMLRRKGVAGGFDERAELPAGDFELRIYLTLPDEETQLRTMTGRLPPGSLRTLRVRVDAAGGLVTQLH